MEIDQPTPETVAAVSGAVAWFEGVAIHGVRLEEFTGADGKRDKRVVADPAAEPLWRGSTSSAQIARFSPAETRSFATQSAKSSTERRNGYSYYVTSPASLLAKDYPRWCAKLKPRERSSRGPQSKRYPRDRGIG